MSTEDIENAKSRVLIRRAIRVKYPNLNHDHLLEMDLIGLEDFLENPNSPLNILEFV